MGFYRMTAYFDLSSYNDVRVKEYLNLDNALADATYQVHDYLNLINDGALDPIESDWDSVGQPFRFYGVDKDGENFVTVEVEEVDFEDQK
jgi:hypothetical protein